MSICWNKKKKTVWNAKKHYLFLNEVQSDFKKLTCRDNWKKLYFISDDIFFFYFMLLLIDNFSNPKKGSEYDAY